jgi:DNA-binding beta-propeller fold protein YncE
MRLSVAGTLALSFAFLLPSSPTGANPPQGGYHLLKKIPLGPAPGGGEYFDYITFDASTRLVYVSHGTEFKVLNADSGAVVGTVTGLKRCHGVALVNELGKGFITDGDAGTVVIFDLKTFKVTGEVKAAPDADAILYDPASKRVFSFNGDSKNSTVIDPKSGTVVGTIDFGGGPENAVADGKGTIYNNNEEKNDVVVIDSRTLTIKARWPVAPAGGPTAIAMDREHRRIFSTGRNPAMLVVMDADNGKVIQSFPISAGVDAAVYEPATGLVFCSTREGMIHIFHEDTPDKFSKVEDVKTEYGAKTMALDPKTHNLYLSTSDFGPPPAPTPKRPNPNPVPIPGTFRLLIYGR